jgi:hypothetical protein
MACGASDSHDFVVAVYAMRSRVATSLRPSNNTPERWRSSALDVLSSLMTFHPVFKASRNETGRVELNRVASALGLSEATCLPKAILLPRCVQTLDFCFSRIFGDGSTKSRLDIHAPSSFKLGNVAG